MKHIKTFEDFINESFLNEGSMVAKAFKASSKNNNVGKYLKAQGYSSGAGMAGMSVHDQLCVEISEILGGDPLKQSWISNHYFLDLNEPIENKSLVFLDKNFKEETPLKIAPPDRRAYYDSKLNVVKVVFNDNNPRRYYFSTDSNF